MNPSHPSPEQDELNEVLADHRHTSKNSLKYEWANISGDYKRDSSDWVRLCTRCHHLIDNTYSRMVTTRKELNAKSDLL